MSGKGKEEAANELRNIEAGYLSKKKPLSKQRLTEMKTLSKFIPEDQAIEMIHQQSRSPWGQQKVVRFEFNRSEGILQVAGLMWTAQTPTDIRPTYAAMCAMADQHFQKCPMVFVFPKNSTLSAAEIRRIVLDATMKYGMRSTSKKYKAYVSSVLSAEAMKRNQLIQHKNVSKKDRNTAITQAALQQAMIPVEQPRIRNNKKKANKK